ncbi:MAG: VanZ family protein [Pyrinomonadaceae bacterium]|nr:VanZ family protein [Pyrinomonadaceae bacterium]
MSVFSSERERRLWLWTVAVVVAIYSTLGLARTISDAMRDNGLIPLGVGLFIVGCLMVLAAVITQGLRSRPAGIEIAVALGVAASYIFVFVRMGSQVERSHLVEYGVVAIFIFEALSERAANGRRVPFPALLAILAATIFGVLDELIQLFLPSRVFDPIDMFFNFGAAAMAVSASVAIKWARRRVK